MSQRAYLMIVEEGRAGVALVRQDGHHTLPRLDGWDGESDSLAGLLHSAASAREAAAAAWRPALPPLTVLANLAEHSTGSDDAPDRAELVLCEPGLDADLAGLSLEWWTADDEDPVGVPPALVTALRSAYRVLMGSDTPAEDGVRWPRHTLPGATRAFAAALAAEKAATGWASLPSARGPGRTSDLTQLRGWFLSSVWTNDQVVLKVTHPNWPAEPAINRLLNGCAPHLVEEVLASGFVHSDGHAPTPWLVQRLAGPPHAGLTERGAPFSPERVRRLRPRSVHALAALQLSLADRSADLLAAGVADRTIDAVAAELPNLWRSLELSSTLEPVELDALPRLDEHLRSRLAALAALGGPPLLAHGDLHLGNVVETPDGEIRFIDWTDAALTWAGVDLLTLLPRLTEVAEREALTAAYEEAIGPAHAPAVRPGLELSPLFHALSYAKIDAFLPPSVRWHFAGTVTRLVRRLLTQVTA